jgi:hypothetical protein
LLPALGRDLGTIRPLLRDAPEAARRGLDAWRARLGAALESLRARRSNSLFDRAAIERYLAASRP